MQTENKTRIVSTFIAVAAFAVCVARHIFFPETSYMVDIPIALLVFLSLYGIWGRTAKKEESSND